MYLNIAVLTAEVLEFSQEYKHWCLHTDCRSKSAPLAMPPRRIYPSHLDQTSYCISRGTEGGLGEHPLAFKGGARHKKDEKKRGKDTS